MEHIAKIRRINTKNGLDGLYKDSSHIANILNTKKAPPPMIVIKPTTLFNILFLLVKGKSPQQPFITIILPYPGLATDPFTFYFNNLIPWLGVLIS